MFKVSPLMHLSPRFSLSVGADSLPTIFNDTNEFFALLFGELGLKLERLFYGYDSSTKFAGRAQWRHLGLVSLLDYPFCQIANSQVDQLLL